MPPPIMPPPQTAAPGCHTAVYALQAQQADWTHAACSNPTAGTILDQFQQLTEPPKLQALLDHCDGNRARAAQLLGIHRGTLRDNLRKDGIDRLRGPFFPAAQANFRPLAVP